MQQSTHIIPQCDTATAGVRQDVFSQQCLGRPRWQTTGSPGSWLSSQTQAHRAQHSHRRGAHTAGVFSEVWRKETLCSLKESLSVPRVPSRVWLPLSHLFSGYLDRCCICVFTWCFYDICTYFFTVTRVALGSDSEQVTEVWQGRAEHPRCRLGRRVLEETWAQGQSEESQRRKTIRLLPVLWKQVRSDTQFKGSVNIAHSKCSV